MRVPPLIRDGVIAAVGWTALRFLFVTGPGKLAESAVTGWINDRIADRLAIGLPEMTTAVSVFWEWIAPALIVLLIVWWLHSNGRRAGFGYVSLAQLVDQLQERAAASEGVRSVDWTRRLPVLGQHIWAHATLFGRVSPTAPIAEVPEDAVLDTDGDQLIARDEFGGRRWSDLVVRRREAADAVKDAAEGLR